MSYHSRRVRVDFVGMRAVLVVATLSLWSCSGRRGSGSLQTADLRAAASKGVGCRDGAGAAQESAYLCVDGRVRHGTLVTCTMFYSDERVESRLLPRRESMHLTAYRLGEDCSQGLELRGLGEPPQVLGRSPDGGFVCESADCIKVVADLVGAHFGRPPRRPESISLEVANSDIVVIARGEDDGTAVGRCWAPVARLSESRAPLVAACAPTGSGSIRIFDKRQLRAL